MVDRLWPRGVSKTDLQGVEWAQELAPSPELRRWFDHEPERFDEFSRRYRAELEAAPALIEFVNSHRSVGRIVMLYAARDPRINHAVILADVLRSAFATAQR
ncbi:DUF488 domain-containing protein [Devriesea agamarum]|uniref:DUF488 domain-containing protein n=1 Tax=Devriesea agamarum TaxID=472569 RepID=UPI0022B24EDC|nr:DUF488 family protein [Devriesea agamarum]